MNSWYQQELASAEGEDAGASTDWLPEDAELVDFIDRLVFLLHRLRGHGLDKLEELIDKHWWRTFQEGYQFAAHLLANSKYQLRKSPLWSVFPERT